MEPQYFFPLLGMTFALAWGVIGTVRYMIKERAKAWSAGSVDGASHERLAALEARLAELEERVDFTERLLARGQEGAH